MGKVVAFASFFLGLISGPVPVEILVGERVAAVELLLDGAAVARLTGPPWVATCDFGADLAPRRLEAIARDAAGSELARAEQLINLARPPADASLVIEEDALVPVARLAWHTVVGGAPSAVTVTLDGLPLEVSDPQRIPLPPLDLRQVHFLRAEVHFPGHLSSVVEAAFGGSHAGEIRHRLTAVPVSVQRGARALSGADLDGLLLRAETPLTVAAVEEGPSEIVVVRDVATQAGLDVLANRWKTTVFKNRHLQSVYFETPSVRFLARLKPDQHVSFLFPVGRVTTHSTLFPRSAPFTSKDGGLYWLLTQVRPPAIKDDEQRIADAVAVAALQAAARNRRRAVVLVLGDASRDASLYSPAQVRRYLELLRVPLFVWSPGGDGESAAGAWGDVADVSSLGKLEREVDRLVKALERQRIVWVDGSHLPHEIALSATASGVDLLR